MLLPFIVPRIQFDRRESAHGVDTELLSDSNLFSADAVSVIAQPTRSTFLLPRPTFVEQSIVRLPDVRYAIEATIFPGLLLLAGFVVFVVRPRSPAAADRGEPPPSCSSSGWGRR